MKYIITLILLCILSFANSHKHTNSLINSTSPYLLQHSHNPIDWYTWDKETLKKAKDENKLIFLSIGYSTCHWCHVMEAESFENETLAKIFNKDYISIKVDREVDTHLDIHYQDILASFKNRRNGWPLNAILTPDLEVLYITTYIPPSYNYGTAGLDTILAKYVKIFNDNDKLKKLIKSNKKTIEQKDIYQEKDNSNLESKYIKSMEEVFDNGFKGFFKRPRFPHAANLDLLYDIYDLTKNKKAIKMVYEPLTAIAKGGIYDQVDGAFFRYSVHPDWIIPHFEKMLYTTAELVPIYTRAYLDTKNELYKNVVVKSLKEIQNRFTKDGLFYSASNADSNGAEGLYYLHTYEEAFQELVKNGFTKQEANNNLEYLDITTIGNFEGDLSNPHFNNNFEEDIKPTKIKETLEVLKDIRKKREYPFIDKKIITSWNAMMIKAFLSAGQIDKSYENIGLTYLDNLLKELYIDGELYHYKIGNSKISQKALLEDYSFLIDTLLYAYKVNYDENYLKIAKELTKDSLKKFYKNDKWYLDIEHMVKPNFNDKYYTSALGKMFENLITISNYTYDMSLLYKTKKMIKSYQNQILNDMQNHSSAIKAIIRVQRGDVILKANKQNLQKYKNDISDIKYPFLYTKYENEKDFLACDESTCFGFSNNFGIIKNKIIKYLHIYN